mmetsp:Transcript_10452/g.17335  ORF Transcript_10452/g.17335 Transcript_10452/m.17335 type:complete len:214 (-) Transcript_10452:365-1006(-)
MYKVLGRSRRLMKELLLTRRCIGYTSWTTLVIVLELMTATSASVVLVSGTSSSSRFSLIPERFLLRPCHMRWHRAWGLACCNQVEVNKREIEILVDSCWWTRSAFNAVRIHTHFAPLANSQPQMLSLVQLHRAIPEHNRTRITRNLLEQVYLLVSCAKRNRASFITYFDFSYKDSGAVDTGLVDYQLYFAYKHTKIESISWRLQFALMMVLCQ